MAADPQEPVRHALSEHLAPTMSRAVLVAGIAADRLAIYLRLRAHVAADVALISLEWREGSMSARSMCPWFFWAS